MTTTAPAELCQSCTRNDDGGLAVDPLCIVHNGLVTVLDNLARQNTATGEHSRLIAGTFALYPAAGGGVVLVVNATEGPPELVTRGPLRKHLGPALINALEAWEANGANPFKLFAAFAKGRKRDRAGG